MARIRSLLTCMLACLSILIDPGICLPLGTGDIEFYRERVEITVSENTAGGYDVRVQGDYYFRNPTNFDSEKMLFYPFPDYAGASYPGDIRVVGYRGILDGRPVSPGRSGHGISFPVRVASSSTALIRVNYLQHTETARAIYITTTTTAWRIPLETAEFIVHLPASLALKDLNYPVDHVEKEGDGTVAHVLIRDFMPDEDLIFSWTTREESLDHTGFEPSRRLTSLWPSSFQ